ncbi:MAG: RsmB/NOP family class SAM-dependent methyltransferase [Verrucomicrobiales bacterium]|nr:RsmB/NOP family class SAM-dependent methyltransferase [Verrucomicrobiales bacterium]
MAQRIHRLLAEACVTALQAVFTDGMVADRAVGRALGANPKWGSRDRSFVAATVYEAVRWRRRLEVLADVIPGPDSGGENDGAPAPEETGRETPNHWWRLCGILWQSQGYERPDWAPWPEVPSEVLAVRESTLSAAPLAVRASLADGFDSLGSSALGDRWEPELTALNQPAPVFLRVNTLRTKVPAVQRELREHALETAPVPGAPAALRVLDGKAVPARLRDGGHFEIQDAGSQQVAPFLLPEPGQRVVDACAGAGGKTLHLAALMAGKGELRAMDVEPAKLATLRQRAARAGAKVWTSTVSDEVLRGMAGWADRVLVDAPCSGSGTLRRQADLKYRITSASVAGMQEGQRTVLTHCFPLVRPGGRLVYATCSVLPAENQAQAAWFSHTFPEFEFEEDRVISPAETGWDGFYMARWRRK